MFYDILMKECEKQHLKITPLVLECGGTKGALSGWRKGASPNSDIVLKLACRLNVSTDYLLGRTDNTIANTNNVSVSGVNNGVVGHNNSSVTIHNSKDNNNSDFSTQEKDLLRIFRTVSSKQQLRLMNFAFSLEEENT